MAPPLGLGAHFLPELEKHEANIAAVELVLLVQVHLHVSFPDMFFVSNADASSKKRNHST